MNASFVAPTWEFNLQRSVLEDVHGENLLPDRGFDLMVSYLKVNIHIPKDLCELQIMKPRY
jgi:hypothetical protein